MSCIVKDTQSKDMSWVSRHRHPKRPLFFFLAFCLSSMVSSIQAASMPDPAHPSIDHISSNPAAVNYIARSGLLQDYLYEKVGIKDDHGIRFGGVIVSDVNSLLAGGVPHAKIDTNNNLFLFNTTIDTEKFAGWKGGMFGTEFLQFNGQDTNAQAGAIQGYNSLPAIPPFNRSELYQLWFRQELFDNRLIVRVGKSVPTLDFNNVVKPVALQESHSKIPVVTGLIYTPIYVNSSTLGVLPGYYNSAYGVVVSFTPNKHWYLSTAMYDGNLARGINTGTRVLPLWNGSYFQIAETGVAWLLGSDSKPGNIALGAWHQTGPILPGPGLYEKGASGLYLFGSQRLWYRHPGIDNSGLSMFYQYGINNSSVLPVTQFVGNGLTVFGMTPNRPDDSFGLGSALAWLNPVSFSRRTEWMLQAYYQAQVRKDVYFEPVISYLPTPGLSPSIRPTWASTFRIIILF